MLNKIPGPVKAFGAVAAVLFGTGVSGCTTTEGPNGTTIVNVEWSDIFIGAAVIGTGSFIAGKLTEGDVNVYVQDSPTYSDPYANLNRNSPVIAIGYDPRTGRTKRVITSYGNMIDGGCVRTNQYYEASNGYSYLEFDCRAVMSNGGRNHDYRPHRGKQRPDKIILTPNNL